MIKRFGYHTNNIRGEIAINLRIDLSWETPRRLKEKKVVTYGDCHPFLLKEEGKDFGLIVDLRLTSPTFNTPSVRFQPEPLHDLRMQV